MTASQSPGPADSAIKQPVDPGANSDPRTARPRQGARVGMVAAGVGRPPRLGEVIADAESALALALVELDRDVDPASETGLAALLVAGARLSIETALSYLAKASEFPARQDPAVTGPVATPGEPASTDPSPGSAAPVSLPARGVGREVVWPGYVVVRRSNPEARA